MARMTVFIRAVVLLFAGSAGALAQEEQMNCDAAVLQWAIGELPDDAMIERARIEAGAASVRVIADSMMVTQDYRAERLNIELDAQGRVRAVRCG